MAKLLRRKSSVKGLETDLSNIKSAAGLASDLTYTQHTTSNYIDAAQSLRAADLLLDGAIKTANDALGSVGSLTTTATTVVGAINEIDAEVGALSSLATTEKGTIVAAINEVDAATNTNATAIADETTRAEAAEEVLKDRLDLVQGDAETEGSIEYALADAKAYADGVAADSADAIEEVEARLDIIEGADTVVGSIAKAEKDAKAYTDTKIAALGNVFEYVGTIASATNADLTALAKQQAGDTYRVTEAGTFTHGEISIVANVGDLITFGTSGTPELIDASNTEVTGTSSFVSVTGSTDTGFVVDIDSAFKGRVTTAESDIDALETRATTIETAATALTGRVGTAESDIDALETRATTIETAATALTGRVGTAESNIATNATAITNLDTATLKKASNLSDVADVATARTNLSVYSKTEVDTAISTQSNATKNAVGVISGTAGSHKVVFANKPVGGVDGIAFGVVRIYGVDGSEATYDEVEVSLDTTDGTGKTFIISSSEDYSDEELIAKAFITYNPTV